MITCGTQIVSGAPIYGGGGGGGGGDVPSTRQIIAGTGLTGGGDLSADRTLTVAYGSTSGTATQGNDSRVVNAVQTSRQVIAGTGLTGGGDLSADRTLAVAYGSTSGTAAQGNDSRLSDARTPTSHAASHGSAGSDPITIASTQVTGLGTASGLSVGTTAGTVAAGDDSRIVNAVPNTRQIIAGTGLTGGGDLTANRTLSVSYGTTAGTAAQGNDLRITSAVPSSRTFAGLDLSADRTANNVRVALNLGAAAMLNVGTTADTVAAGNDSRIVNAVPTSRTIAGLALSNNITASALNTALGSSSSIGVRTLAPDTGWANTIGTNQPGGTASVSIASGVHTFTGQGGGFAIETRPAISTPECPAVEWMGRFTVVTGNPTNAWYTSLSITSATDSAGYLAQVLTDQTVSLYVRAEGGSWTLVSVGPGLIPLASGAWLRLVVTPSYAAAYWGTTGSSTPPTIWNLSSSVATTVAMLAGRSLTHFGVRQGRTGAGAAVTTEWTDLQYRILGVSP